MKVVETFVLIILIQFTNCLNYSADNVNCILLGPSIDYRIVIRASEPEKILKQDIFNPLLKTVFIIAGIPATINDTRISLFIQSYIETKRYNVIFFEGVYYLSDLPNTNVFGEILLWFGELYGSVISKLITSGLSVDSIELVGHSWGASAAYLAATKTIPKLPLLIGLDPNNINEFRKGGADYTIALHSNIGQHGQINYNSSDSDLIANGGVIQPMCADLTLHEIQSTGELKEIAQCSHIAALYYWGSIIKNPELFYGVECNDIKCNYKNVQRLGPNLRSPGTFYFKTSKTSPYGLGLDGIKNVSPMDRNLLNTLQFRSPLWKIYIFCIGGYCSPKH